MFAHSERIYLGTNMEEAARIRAVLDQHQISYSCRVRNRNAQWIGRGTLRGCFGSALLPTKSTYEYEILVHKRDKELASHLIRQ